MTLEDLELRFPGFPWRTPLPIDTPSASGFACRVCLANTGIRGFEVAGLPQTQEEFERHWEKYHAAV
jgi:hypothetical protein